MTEKREKAVDSVNTVQKSLDSMKLTLPGAPVFAFLEKFDAFVQKKKKVLAREEVLFEPGENPYFYIVSSGALAIFQISPTGDRKEVGKVYTGSFLGEWVISDRNHKNVQAVSVGDRTEVVFLTKPEIEYLESQSPETLAKLYKHMNNISSLRLADTSQELATLYEITEKFQEFRERGQKWLLDTIIHLKDILSLSAVLLIEEHPIAKGLRVYKFNSRFPTVWPMNQKVDPDISLVAGEYKGPLIMGTKPGDSIYISPLETAGKIVGYMVLSGKKPLKDNEIRIVRNASMSMATMLEQSQAREDQKARNMKEGVFVA